MTLPVKASFARGPTICKDVSDANTYLSGTTITHRVATGNTTAEGGLVRRNGACEAKIVEYRRAEFTSVDPESQNCKHCISMDLNNATRC